MTRSVEEQLRHQALYCGRMGSPLMAALLTGAAADVAAGGVLADLLAPHAGDPTGSVLPLRLAGALHRLVLERRAPELAVHYPSVGGSAPVDAVWPAAERACREHAATVAQLLHRPVQTNEVGRCAALAGVLAHVRVTCGLPVRLLEVGASAGLVLRVDGYAYELADRTVLGDPASPVRLTDPWHGAAPPAELPEVVARRGCDPAPLDPGRTDDRLTLTSYVWADQLARLARLRGAFAVAERVPVVVEPADVATWLPRVLAEPADDVVTVLWHSVVRQYLSPQDRDLLDRLPAEAGQAGLRLVHACLEPERFGGGSTQFLVRARSWPGGAEVVLGRCDGHGTPVRWTGAGL